MDSSSSHDLTFACLLVTCLLVFATAGIRADIIDSAPHGFTSVHDVTIKASPDRVFTAMTSEVSKWWDPPITHTPATPAICPCSSKQGVVSAND